MMRTRSTWLMIAPLTLTLLLAILAVGCSAFGPSAQDISNKTAIAGIQASLSALNDQRTMTADAANLRGTSTQAAGTARALLHTQNNQATGTARADATATGAAIATATAGPSLAEANAPAGWNLILYEPFADNKNRWPEGADDSNQWVHEEHSVSGGQYLVKARAKQGFSSYSYPEMPNVLDFYVTLDARLESGEPASDYGLIVNLDQNTGDFYAFFVNEQGYWAISLRKGGFWAPIKNGRSSQIVSGGNHLAVLCTQNDFTFYVNNQEIARAHDDRLSAPGKTGVIIEGSYGGAESTISFDNFTVLTP